MNVRLASNPDLDAIMSVISDAKAKMRRSGNMHQWVGGYPSSDDILADISAGCGYVCLDDCGRVAGYFAMIAGDEPTYARIYDGQWLNESPYLTIHRIASGKGAKGVFAAMLEFASSRSGNIRIDTHADNSIMRHILDKYGFIYCGIIFLKSGAVRLAFQKVILTGVINL